MSQRGSRVYTMEYLRNLAYAGMLPQGDGAQLAFENELDNELEDADCFDLMAEGENGVRDALLDVMYRGDYSRLTRRREPPAEEDLREQAHDIFDAHRRREG